MALINHAKREINAKIVYYGPEGTGKRSSLQYIYDRVKPSLRGELKSPASKGDSLFFFDFSPFEKPVFGDYRLRFHVYTLPGKVSNPAAWKMTLKGADGLVIVADTSSERLIAARESISVLRGFLSAYGVGLHDVPCVLQLNKAGIPQNSPSVDLAATLDLPGITTSAFEPESGQGVLETLSLLSRQIMERIGQDDALQAKECVVTHEVGDDAEVAAALHSLEIQADRKQEESIQLLVDSTPLPAVQHAAAGEQPQVVLADEGALCNEGVVRVPLEIRLGGIVRRLVVSIALEEYSPAHASGLDVPQCRD
jgi:signal recognition particle receptor subunit beta